MNHAAKTLAVAALILSAAPAFAQNTPAAGQEPPLVADKGTTAQYKCIEATQADTGDGKHPVFRIQMTNKCEQRLKCGVFAYIVSPKGPSQGRTTLILGPKSSGASATKVFEVKIKANGGMQTWTRECRTF